MFFYFSPPLSTYGKYKISILHNCFSELHESENFEEEGGKKSSTNKEDKDVNEDSDNQDRESNEDS